MNVDLTSQSDKYDGLWLALGPDGQTIVGRGVAREEAIDNAKSNGFTSTRTAFVA